MFGQSVTIASQFEKFYYSASPSIYPWAACDGLGVPEIALYLVCLNFEETFDVFYETFYSVFS